LVKFQDIVEGGFLAAGGLKDFATGLVSPTLRLGVTGLSRSGKTVFITALVHALLKGARLPVFEAYAKGRITRCYLEPQPDDELPRFAYEENLACLAERRNWPEGTRRISQLRLTIEYEPQGLLARKLHGGKLHLDIIDYPGEWLLDLPLMNQTYAQWSAATVASAKSVERQNASTDWLQQLASVSPTAQSDELKAQDAAKHFTTYLARCREKDLAMSMVPPGRFLLPGDLAGSPLLTFAPMDIAPETIIEPGTLAALMARRFDSYVAKVVKPFFYGHFARLDRQIVMVDVLTALNAGNHAVKDLQSAIASVMDCFRIGANSIASELFGRRVERILFAATKADLLHHHDHDKLEAVLRLLVDRAAGRAEAKGAVFDVSAIAAVRATREAKVTQRGEELLCIAGTPEAGEEIGPVSFDGEKDAAIFPGDLPSTPEVALEGGLQGKLQFVKFRPPEMKDGQFPHIRLDRAVEFLLGDRFK
jgi:uncharacterized protein